MVNVALAQEVLDYIAEHPERHYQRSWFYAPVESTEPICGTTMCVGGTVIFLTEGFPALRNLIRGSDINESRMIDEAAGAHLGLTQEEYDKLFYTMSEERAIEGLRFLANDDIVGFREYFGLDQDLNGPEYLTPDDLPDL